MYMVCTCNKEITGGNLSCPVHGIMPQTQLYVSECSTCKTLREALREIKTIARDGRDWNPGHFCESRSKMQSIFQRCENALKR